MSAPYYTTQNTTPYGYCHCNCGKKTNIAKQDYPKQGVFKGEPFFYLRGHSNSIPIELRFWEKVEKGNSENDCWLWTGAHDSKGYGQIVWNKKRWISHRVSYILAYGEISNGLDVLHNCPNGDNPSCVNPNHLWLGTHQDNMQDMMKKGRGADQHGENGSSHKLSKDDVLLIRNLYSEGNVTQRELAEKFGVDHTSIGHIIRRTTWMNI